MTFPSLAGEHTILSSEFCSGYRDVGGTWNTGFYCPQTGSTLAVFCCGTPLYKYCCTNMTTGTGIVNRDGSKSNNGGVDGEGSDYSAGGARLRPLDDGIPTDPSSNDLTSLNLSDVPIIFGVACGVAAVLILVILAGFYLTSCCAHYHQIHQNRKRRSSLPGLYRGVTTTNASTSSGLVNLYSPTNSGGDGIGGAALTDSTETYTLRHHGSISNPPASPDSSEHYQIAGGGTSLVTTPLDIEWSSTAHYLQQRTQMPLQSAPSTSQPLNLLSNHVGDGGVHVSNPATFYPANAEHTIHYTVHQTQNRLAVALSGSMNRLNDRPSPCPPSYPVNIPLTPPEGYMYSRQCSQSQRDMSPPPQYTSSLMSRSESPPYYPYDSGSSNNTDNLNYLNRTATLPTSLSRKPLTPSSSNRPSLTSPGPYTNLPLQQPKSILRTSQNYRRVVTNETPPPVPPHGGTLGIFGGGQSAFSAGSSGTVYTTADGMSAPGTGAIAYRNVVDSRSSQPLLLLEHKIDNQLAAGEVELGIDNQRNSVLRVSNAAINTNHGEEEDESRDHFDIHDIDSDALSRLIELDLDSKL